MAREVKIEFDAFGNTKLDAVGFQGSSCKAATANYLQALAPSQKDNTDKPEFAMPNVGGVTAGSRW